MPPAERVLVVEDEFIVADELAAVIESAGYAVVGPAGSVASAEALLAQKPPPDFAVVDANLRGNSSAQIARRLRELDVPFCVCTGYRISDLRPTFGDVVLLQKPIDPGTLLGLIQAALAARKAPPARD